MWLKLDTGMVVILLLFRVLTRKPESVSICPTEAYMGGRAGLLTGKRADSHTVFHDPPSSWTPGSYAEEHETQSHPQGKP